MNSSSRFSESTAILQNFKLQQDLSREHQQKTAAASTSQNTSNSAGNLLVKSSNSPTRTTTTTDEQLHHHQQVIQPTISTSTSIVLREDCSSSPTNMSSIQQQQNHHHSPTKQQTSLPPTVSLSNTSGQLSSQSIAAESPTKASATTGNTSSVAVLSASQQMHNQIQDMNTTTAYQDLQFDPKQTTASTSSSPTTTAVEAASFVQPSSSLEQQTNAQSNTSTTSVSATTTTTTTSVVVTQPNTTGTCTASSMTTNVTPASAPITNPDTRTHVVGELYDTERSYVESLQILVEKYMKPLKSLESNRILIESNLVDEIFYTIPEILQHHENFLSALQDRLSSDWDTSQVIGNVFIEVFTNQQIIDTYTAFINNWKNARQAIKIATQAKPAFERYLEAMSREHRNKLTLDALLIMPVQRIPRYELLIKELIKHTPEDHPDYGPLIEAQKEIHELALKIDRAEREMMHQEQLKDLESLIEGHVELQHPQRDFIRYDLVTILGASALTVAKKERVLFLFCDLLIMTSVKKKTSRRSNLQSAFANSSNDVSLLEGNKFKLLLRVPLDQVEVRLENDAIQQQQQQQQQQEQQHQLQLQKKLIQDRKREIEADFQILHQIESLILKMSSIDRSKLNENISEMSSQLKQGLSNLDQSDLQTIAGAHHSLGHQAQAVKEMCALQAPNSGSLASPIARSSSQSNSFTTLNTNQILLSTGNQLQGFNVSPTPSSQTTIQSNVSSSTNHQHDTNTSLEFLISNCSPSKDAQNVNIGSNTELTSSDQNFSVQSMESQSSNHQNILQTSNCETLVVTFASIDRRQAFLQAFIEAKQQRYKLQQQRQQQQRIFSSSITLRLSQRNASDKRNNALGINQLENLDTRISLDNLPVKKGGRASQQQPLANTTIRNSSAPLQHTPCGAMIVHQMSAPQNLALSRLSGSQSESKEMNLSQCNSCSSNLASEDDKPHHRNHHQLMHQPASHPASLNTIRCLDHHNEDNGATKFTQPPINRADQSFELTGKDKIKYQDLAHQSHYRDYMKHQQHQQLSNSSIISLNDDPIISGAVNTINSHKLQLLVQIDHELLFKTAPKFLLTLPVNFLNTQHPALQFSCSSFENSLNKTIDSKRVDLSQQKSQTVRDSSGNLWLCMSNGYVSHVALISLKKKRLHSDLNARYQDEYDDLHSFKRCYNIVPIIKSAGDICKSHINCAAQVRWPRRPILRPDDKRVETSSDHQPTTTNANTRGNITDVSNEETKPAVEVKTVSPPVDIKLRPSRDSSRPETRHRLSESAPSNCDELNENKLKLTNKSSASTTRLEVPFNHGKLRNSPRKSCSDQQNINLSCREGRRSMHENICQRYHGAKHSQNRLSAPGMRPIHHSHNHWHHHAQHGDFHNGKDCRFAHHHSHHHSHHPHHHHHHHHYHHHHHHHPQNHAVHHLYAARHNTVPITELRRALENQSKVFDQHRGPNYHNHQLPPPANTPAEPVSQQSGNQTSIGSETSERLSAGFSSLVTKKFHRSATPPGCYSGGKSFRSARMLRHQASLKTSSILAKLVGSATKHSSHTSSSRKTSQSQDKHSDFDDNDTDTDNGSIRQHRNSKQDDNFLDNNISAITTPSSKKCPANSSQTDMNNAVISPLSSVSSLNSTNSSITVNSVCASSPNRSSCDLLAHSASVTCCTGIITDPKPISPQCLLNQPSIDYGIRNRSATVPCRALCSQSSDGSGNDAIDCVEMKAEGKIDNDKEWYKISEIIGDLDDKDGELENSKPIDGNTNFGSSLWLGCDDGSLLVIDCLTSQSENNSCNECDQNQQANSSCGNVHSEIKLNASVCDISVYKDETAFVALSNGQMAIFSRVCDSDKESVIDSWCLANPKVLTVTANELNSTSKLCLIDDEYLWYSYGRNIFVLNITTLKLETTIMAPTNDLSLQFTMQSITINNMVLMTSLAGVWVSFKNSHLIQLYDVKKYKLLLEINLFDSINKMLSYGNEIIRQHKTACLKATSLLNVSRKDYETLFIGTSAGLILYLNIQHDQLISNELLDGSINDWVPQIASLRHGHSGHVKFLHLIEIEEDSDQESDQPVDVNNNDSGPTMKIDTDLFLISGGSGVDVYGPTGEHQFVPNLNSDEDSMNHLLLWQL